IEVVVLLTPESGLGTAERRLGVDLANGVATTGVARLHCVLELGLQFVADHGFVLWSKRIPDRETYASRYSLSRRLSFPTPRSRRLPTPRGDHGFHDADDLVTFRRILKKVVARHTQRT